MSKTTTPVAEMTRPELVAILKDADAYSGHSRDGIDVLRKLVTQLQAAAEPATDRTERIRLAKAEHKTLQAWIKDGEKPPRPATPNLDALEEESNRKPGTAKRKATTGKRRAARPAGQVRYFHDGTPMPDSQNKLSSLAWYHTKGVDGDRVRISATELRQLLTDAGADLEGSWSVDLPNGVTLSCEVKA